MTDYAESLSSSGTGELGDNDSSLSPSEVQFDNCHPEEGKALTQAVDTAIPAEDPPSSSENEEDPSSKAVVMAPRAYQLEMFSESVRRNIIVVVRKLHWALTRLF